MSNQLNGTVCFVGFGYVGKESYHLFPHTKAFIIDEQEISTEYIGSKVPADDSEAVRGALEVSDLVVISLPTELNPAGTGFQYEAIYRYLDELMFLPPLANGNRRQVIIRSTLGSDFPVQERQPFHYVPEFLTEDRLGTQQVSARLIVGSGSGEVLETVAFQAECYQERLDMTVEEAIHVKLFSNAYLAMRVAYFNEVDTECRKRRLDPARVMAGIKADYRIGQGYARTSFGYGGKCLPKDVQLLGERLRGKSPLLQAIHASNDQRKNFVVNQIRARNPMSVGVYRLGMKPGSSTFTNSATLEVIQTLVDTSRMRFYIYEPLVTDEGCEKLQTGAQVYWIESLGELNDMDLVIADHWVESLRYLKAPILCLDSQRSQA